MNNLFRKRGTSVFLKLLLGFFVFIGVVYFITLSIIQDSKENVKKEVIDNMVFQLKSYGKTLELDIEQIIKMQSELFLDTDLIRLSTWDERYLNEFERLNSMRRLLDKLVAVKSSTRYLYEVRANIPLVNKVLSSNTGPGSAKAEDENGIALSGDQEMQQYKLVYKDGKLMLIMNKNSLETKKFIYNLVFEISSDEMERFLYNFAQAGKGEAFLFDRKRTWSIETNNGTTDEDAKKSVYQYLDDSQKNEVEYFDVNNKKYISINYYIKSLDADLVVYCAEEVFLGRLQMYTEKTLVISIFTSLFALAFSFYVFSVIVNPLNRLTRAFKKMENGDMSTTISHKRDDEFGYLYNNFNHMTKRIKRLIEEVYEQKILAQRAELKQLQYQINPHFLYNSLFLIFMMAKSRDYENIVVFTNHLSAYYKFITKANINQVTLAEEVEHTTNYINIQKIRFQDRICVEMGELPEDFRNLMVPRLIIQPLVENAFEHGLKEIQKEGYIKIGFSQEADYIIVTVEDNGPSVHENNLQLLQKYLDEEDESAFDSTGLINVHRRLRIRFGGKSGIQVRKNISDGITVIMYIYRGGENGI